MRKLIALFAALFLLGCSYSKKEEIEYYRIFDIYRNNKESFRFGAHYFIQKIYDADYHFTKKGNKLSFDYPQKMQIDMDKLKSLSNKRVDINSNVLSDSIYFKGIEDGKFKIKFINIYTDEEDKRVTIEFEKISKQEYDADIESSKAITNQNHKK
ncbi:hypothetical protein [Flavobacterium sp. HJSW_4]|uniref:hypothetical protein n=1 Tax=Flavobacterium sp. HJSW_4 TaxID=3344660 RepID=UPI0035F40257